MSIKIIHGLENQLTPQNPLSTEELKIVFVKFKKQRNLKYNLTYKLVSR